MPSPNPNGHRLLILDDDPDVRAASQRFLEASGFAVDCAAERAAAETLVAHYRYACIVVDVAIDVPQGTDGLEILSFLKQRAPGTKIVVVTGNALPGIQQVAFRLGADAFMAKPHRLPDLASLIGGLIDTGGGA